MSHLTVQLGSSLVAPIAPPQWKWRQDNRWRLKAWQEARLTPGDFTDGDARLTRALALWRLPSRPGTGVSR